MRVRILTSCKNRVKNHTKQEEGAKGGRDKETKRQRVGESTVNGQWSMVKERKSGREEGRKTKGPFFETLMFMNLIH